MALSPLSPVIQYNIISFGYNTPGEACASLNLTVASLHSGRKLSTYGWYGFLQ
jgi:hypothetical protein